MGLPESELITYCPSDETTTSDPSSSNSSSTDTNKEEENAEANAQPKTRAVRDTQQDDTEKTTENENEVTEKPPFAELLEDFNAAFSLTGEERSGLFTIFLPEPGKTARMRGPGNGEAVREAVERVDAFIGRVLSVLSDAKLLETGHVVVASTPGYVDVKLTNLITLLDDIEAESSYVVAGHSPVLNIKSEGEIISPLGTMSAASSHSGCVIIVPFPRFSSISI